MSDALEDDLMSQIDAEMSRLKAELRISERKREQLVSALRESQAEVARLREAVAGWRHARVADDGMACWCLTEHAHRKYGCDDMRAALGQPGQPAPAP